MQIDDTQATEAETDIPVNIKTLIIRPTPNHAIGHGPEAGFINAIFRIKMELPAYATHDVIDLPELQFFSSALFPFHPIQANAGAACALRVSVQTETQ